MNVSPLGAQFRERFGAYPTSESLSASARPFQDRVASAQHKWRDAVAARIDEKPSARRRIIARPFTPEFEEPLSPRDMRHSQRKMDRQERFSPRFSTSYQPGFDGYYQGIHAGRDAASGLGYGMVPNATSARGEAFGNFYGGQHAGRDAASGLGPGMVPTAAAARGEAFGNFYGGQHAGMDTASHLGPDMTVNPAVEVSKSSMLTRQEYTKVEDALNSRFADMRKAFQYVDLDGSGTVNRSEIERALKLWNVPLEPGKLDALMAMCDTTGDGEISYAEFVHALARDKTTRGQLAKQEKKVQPSSEKIKEQQALSAATDGINQRFTRMRDAFKWVDVDNSGTVSFTELQRAIDLLGVPMTPEKLELLWNACDTNANGEISYAEFVNAFARDTAVSTVAPAGPAYERKSAQDQARDKLRLMAEDGINARFSDMHKAFQYVDLDRSGTINRQELERGLALMGVQIHPEKLDYFWQSIDKDGSGEIDYKEFVNAFARDTVAPGAMDAPAKVATPREPTPPPPPPRVPTLRDMRVAQKSQLRLDRIESARQKQQQEAAALAAKMKPITPQMTVAEKSQEERQEIAKEFAKHGLNQRFADMRKAFKYVDLDNSGTVDRAELEHALMLWNVPMTKERLDDLWDACDGNQNGEISYAEFVSALARDTVSDEGRIAPAGPSAARQSVEDEARDHHIQIAEDAISNRFSDMRKAFKWVDVDGSGTVNRQELDRALDLMNLNIPRDKIEDFWAAVDKDGSGEIDYTEFCKAFARDSVIDINTKARTQKAMKKY